jgi:hypothetical protein
VFVLRQIVLLTMLACALALGCAFGALASSASGDTTTTSDTTTTNSSTASQWDHVNVQRAIDRYRHRTWHWQRVMGRRVTLTLHHPPTTPLMRIAVWKRIALRTKRIALHPPHLGAWLCIHRYEGAWNDPYGPYYGGLQMDVSFQSAYGRQLLARKGTADHWTPLEQMWVAERALQAGRGFSAWPNSARACGLL